eukprot:COSAG05_NODE_1671_length_4303_cov_2.550666_1_plen_60_part_10
MQESPLEKASRAMRSDTTCRILPGTWVLVLVRARSRTSTRGPTAALQLATSYGSFRIRIL